MEIKNLKLINEFENFIKTLNKDDRIAILHHTDPDGISSAVIMNKIIERIRNKQIDIRINQKPDEFFITKETYKILKEKKINKLIITDLSVDQHEENLLRDIEKFANILIIDHHKLYHDLNSDKTIHIKPQLIFQNVEPSLYCASKLVFDLGSEIVNIDDLDWISALGIIGDNVFNNWKPFIKAIFKKYNLKENGNIFESVLGKATETLFFTEAYNYDKIEECFKTLNDAPDYKTILTSNLSNYSKKVKREINYWKTNVKKFAEFYNNHELIFDYIKPKYSIKSAISSAISSQYPDKTIIIAQDMKREFIELSVRRMDYKIAVNELLERSLKNFRNAIGGGHINSAGGRIRKEDLFKFKSNILNILENREIFR